MEWGIRIVYEGKYPNEVKGLSSILVAAMAKKSDMLLGGTCFHDTVMIIKQKTEHSFDIFFK
jgi:hypothetical protein